MMLSCHSQRAMIPRSAVRSAAHAEVTSSSTKGSSISGSSRHKSGVLIVGGGPAGLATALMLSKRGWKDISILESRATVDFEEPDKSFGEGIATALSVGQQQ